MGGRSDYIDRVFGKDVSAIVRAYEKQVRGFPRGICVTCMSRSNKTYSPHYCSTKCREREPLWTQWEFREFPLLRRSSRRTIR